MTPLEIGFTLGLVWSVILAVWALASVTCGEISQWLVLITYIYEGFDFTSKGIIIGSAWAFADGFVSGYIITYIVQLVSG